MNPELAAHIDPKTLAPSVRTVPPVGEHCAHEQLTLSLIQKRSDIVSCRITIGSESLGLMSTHWINWALLAIVINAGARALGVTVKWEDFT